MKKKPLVGIIMGSQSDLGVMGAAADALEQFGIPCEVTVVSAHRTPKRMFDYAGDAAKRGLKVIIAGAGGAAHLPGMVASITTLPVIGVPVKLANSLNGLDSLLSIVQMPDGIPVATVAVNGAKNAGILAAEIIGLSDSKVAQKLKAHKLTLKQKVEASVKTIARKGFKAVRAASK
jgi:5-(carboxyamino)imidazole ribonucleotide mutase